MNEKNEKQLVPYSKEQINTIRNTVAKGANDYELQMFLELARQYNLDPFKKEIWCFKKAKKVYNPATKKDEYDYKNAVTIIMTSRDGYMKIAKQDPDFLGFQSHPVHEKDNFIFDPINAVVSHSFTQNRGKLVGAYAVAYHRVRKPVAMYFSLDEFKLNNNFWNNYASLMLIKVPETHVLKRIAGITGLLTVEELSTSMNDEEIEEVKEYIKIEEDKPSSNPQALPEPQKNQSEEYKEFLKPIYGIAKELKINDETLHMILKASLKLDSLKQLTEASAKEFLTHLKRLGYFYKLAQKRGLKKDDLLGMLKLVFQKDSSFLLTKEELLQTIEIIDKYELRNTTEKELRIALDKYINHNNSDSKEFSEDILLEMEEQY